jgi:hypothetical protein
MAAPMSGRREPPPDDVVASAGRVGEVTGATAAAAAGTGAEGNSQAGFEGAPGAGVPGLEPGTPLVAAGRCSPHEMQKRRPAGLTRPQAEQVGPEGAGGTGAVGAAAAETGAATGGGGDEGGAAAASSGGVAGMPAWVSPAASSAANSRKAPQLPQKASPATFSVPHFAHVVMSGRS